MARPKGKLFALLAVFVAIGLATATGAFTSVQADRTATVNVAGDQAALLQLTPADQLNSTSEVGSEDYVDFSQGQLQINVDGLNTDATTDLGPVFNITNNGEDDVTVHIEDGDEDSNATFDPDSKADFEYIAGTVGDGDDSPSVSAGDSLEGDSADITLEPGERISVKLVITVDDTFDPTDGDNEFLNGEFVIVADQP